MQELFLENNKILSYLTVSHLFEKKLTKKARILYKELLQHACFSKKDRVLINYDSLEHTLRHSKGYFRSAFRELEDKGYAYRETKHKTKDLYIKVSLEKLGHDIDQTYEHMKKININDNHTGGENGSTNDA